MMLMKLLLVLMMILLTTWLQSLSLRATVARILRLAGSAALASAHGLALQGPLRRRGSRERPGYRTVRRRGCDGSELWQGSDRRPVNA